MAKGLPKSYIKKWGISKRAWREYRKAHKSKSRTTRKSKTKTKKRRTYNLTKKTRKGGKSLVEAYFGYNIPQQKMVWSSLLRGWGPFLAATLVTYGLPKLAGILRRI